MTKVMQIDFDIAEKKFNENCYDESFAIFAAIATNEEYDLLLRSDAYNIMGAIIAGPAPYLSNNDDESGISFFKKSLQLNSKNLSAALNIIETYDNTPTSHQDKEVVRIACQSLQENSWEILSQTEKHLINRIYQKIT